MRALKLPRLPRRNPDRPSLKQRMASLKASAGRVLRRPDRSGEEVDWSCPPEGFLAYPAADPAGFVNIRSVLNMEAKRLHAIASAEFERRAALIEEGGHPSMHAGALDRLRRSLRLDELAVAAAPERPEPAGNDWAQPGFVFYEDASGKVHRRPVADWIGFMAQRLYSVARDEVSRATNASLREEPGQDANALYDRLRRDLRIDALHDLAHRSWEVFEANREYAVGSRWMVKAADPHTARTPELLALWARHKSTAWGWEQPGNSPENKVANEAHAAVTGHASVGIDLAPPTTLEGLGAFALSLTLAQEQFMRADERDLSERGFASLLMAVLSVSGTALPDDFEGLTFTPPEAPARAMHPDDERLARVVRDIQGRGEEAESAAPAGIGDDCVWAVEHRAWIDRSAASASAAWDDKKLDAEVRRGEAVVMRASTIPATTERDLWGKARLALDEVDRFLIEGHEDADSGTKLVRSTLNDVVQFFAAAIPEASVHG